MSYDVEQIVAELIKRKSISGQEEEIAAYIRDLFLQLGFDEANIDRYGNVVGVIHGSHPGKKLLFDSHMDTVDIPNPDNWQHDPFGGEIVDGKLYGRGAADMKGPLGASICGAAAFLEKHGHNFAGELMVTGVCHEECFEGVAAREISRTYQPDCVIICESSSLKMAYCQKGRMEVRVETFGKPCHSSTPWEGVNAVYAMAELIREIRNLKMRDDPDMGGNIIELVDIRSHPYPGASVVPEHCIASYDVRLIVGDTPEIILNSINKVIDRLSQEIPGFRAKASLTYGEAKCYTGEMIGADRFFPAWKSDPDGEDAQAILSAIRSAGFPGEKIIYIGCTNGSHYGGEAGLSTFGFGPGCVECAHQDNEYVPVDQLHKAVEIYCGIAENMLCR